MTFTNFLQSVYSLLSTILNQPLWSVSVGGDVLIITLGQLFFGAIFLGLAYWAFIPKVK